MVRIDVCFEKEKNWSIRHGRDLYLHIISEEENRTSAF